jgi:hypothetical protein
MAMSINPAVSRSVRRFSFHSAAFLLGALLGAAVSFSLAYAGIRLVRDVTSTRIAVAIAALAVALAIGKELGLQIPLPYRRRQVPEGWRGSLPVSMFSLLYGVMLGFGFVSPFTYSTHLAMLAGVPFASSTASLVIALILFAFGKSLVLASTLRRDSVRDSAFRSRTTRFGVFTLHVVTVGTSMLAVIGLSAGYLV